MIRANRCNLRFGKRAPIVIGPWVDKCVEARGDASDCSGLLACLFGLEELHEHKARVFVDGEHGILKTIDRATHDAFDIDMQGSRLVARRQGRGRRRGLGVAMGGLRNVGGRAMRARYFFCACEVGGCVGGRVSRCSDDLGGPVPTTRHQLFDLR